jgi:hypothetical protein
MQLLVIFVISLSWALILPIITKLQGLLWATSIISAYLIIHKLSVFITPYFKHLSIRQSYGALIVLDGLYLVSVLLYFYDPLIFLYTEASLMVVYGIVMTVFGISYDAFLMEKYNSNTFKDVQYLERMSMAVAGIIGYSVVIFIDIISQDIGIAIKTFFVILSINLGFQLYNYIYFWKNLELGSSNEK